MIQLTKLNGTQFILNCTLIETIFETPDTTIHLTNGPLYIVKESADEVVKRAIEYHKMCQANLFSKGKTQE